MKLNWNGSGFLPGVPARDLTDEEVKLYGGEKTLLKSGIYEVVEPVVNLAAELPVEEPAPVEAPVAGKKKIHKVEVSDGRN